jgi:hypothetical protein
MFGLRVARVVIGETQVSRIVAILGLNPAQDFLALDYILTELFRSKLVQIGMRKSMVTQRMVVVYPLLQEMFALLLSQFFHTLANHKSNGRCMAPVQRVQNGRGNGLGLSRIILSGHGKIIKGESDRVRLGLRADDTSYEK